MSTLRAAGAKPLCDGVVVRSAASGGQVSVLSSENNASTVAQASWTYNGLGDQATQTFQNFVTGGNALDREG